MDAQVNEARQRRPVERVGQPAGPDARGRARPLPPPFPLNLHEVAYILSLLINICISSHASQALVAATFGKTFGPISFHFATIVSVLLLSVFSYVSVRAQKRTLEAVAALQVLTALFMRGAVAYAAENIENPTLGALVVHLALSLPLLGLAGGVWLQWISKLLDPEPTLVGRLLTKAISCVALGTVVNYLEPLIGPSVLRFAKLPPNAAFGILAMLTFMLSMTALPDQARSTTEAMTKLIVVLSACMAAIAFSAPPYVPASINILYQRFTPSGLLLVGEYNAAIPPVRYLRHDASIVGVSEIITPDAPMANVDKKSAVYRLSAIEAINDAVRLAHTSKGKNALALGFKSGLLTKSLIGFGYNTTVIEPDRYLYAVAEVFLNTALPSRHAVYFEEPTRWMSNTFSKNASGTQGDVKKFDVLVHDLVRGGEMPAQFYTMEMWEALKALMDEKGVIVVNYLGTLNSITFKSTVNMLLNVFTTCRAYHPNPIDESPLSTPDKLTNIAIFCTPASTLSFRNPFKSDYALGGGIRREVFTSLTQREIDLVSALQGTPRDRFLLRDADPKVKSWGKENINEHWKLMRNWFPSELWSSYTGYWP